MRYQRVDRLVRKANWYSDLGVAAIFLATMTMFIIVLVGASFKLAAVIFVLYGIAFVFIFVSSKFEARYKEHAHQLKGRELSDWLMGER